MDSQNDKKKLAVDLTKLAAREASRNKQSLEVATKLVLEAYRDSLKQVEVSHGDADREEFQAFTVDELRAFLALNKEFTVDELRALLKERSAGEKSPGIDDPPV